MRTDAQLEYKPDSLNMRIYMLHKLNLSRFPSMIRSNYRTINELPPSFSDNFADYEFKRKVPDYLDSGI